MTDVFRRAFLLKFWTHPLLAVGVIAYLVGALAPVGGWWILTYHAAAFLLLLALGMFATVHSIIHVAMIQFDKDLGEFPFDATPFYLEWAVRPAMWLVRAEKQYLTKE